MNQVFLENESFFQGAFASRIFRTIALAYRPFLGRIVLVVILGILARGLLLFIPNVVGFWADSLCLDSTRCKAPPVLFAKMDSVHFVGLIFLMTMVGFLTNTIFRVGVARLGTHAISGLYDQVTTRTSKFPMTFFDRTPLGRIITRFSSDYGAVFRMAGGPMGEFLCIVFDLTFSVVFISIASPYYAPLVFLTVALNAGLWRLNNRILREERRALSAARGPSIAHFNETTQGASTIRVFGRAKIFQTQMHNLMDSFLAQRTLTFYVVQFFSSQMSFVTALLLLATGVMGTFLIQSGRASVPSVAVAFTFVMLTSSTVQQLFEYLANLEDALTGVERLDEYLVRPVEPTGAFPLPVSESTVQNSPHPFLKIHDLSMSYDQKSLVLKNIHLDLFEGESLGVIGRTGSGKSSLLQSLLLLYPWTSGRLSLGGRSFGLPNGPILNNEFKSLEEYRSQFSYLPQQPILFVGNILDNIVSKKESVAHTRVIEVLRQVGLSQLLSHQGSPESTVHQLSQIRVEEHGANFSQGERQLLCLARCLLQNRPVVLMDEATSHIDPVSEKHFVTATQTALAGKTRIIVAHRLSTVAKCHRVLWLDQGQVRGFGKANDILEEFGKVNQNELT